MPGDSRWSDLRLRVLSAAILLPVALACLWLGGLAWVALVLTGGLGMAWEWGRLCRLKPGRWPWLTLAFGGVYLLPAILALVWLRAEPSGRGNVLFVLAVVWASDIGAYVAGRGMGGPKLAPAISPGKTWSGAAGGTLAAAAIGIAAHALWPGHGIVHAVAVAAGLSVLSQLGDLFESGLKRHFGVKDSSRLIPGHGGLLDRLDGVLAAAPAAALLAFGFGQGAALW